jgi:hypothetical protein
MALGEVWARQSSLNQRDPKSAAEKCARPRSQSDGFDRQ